MTAILLPVICLFEPMFIVLRVEPDVAHIAAQYMRYSALGVPVSLSSLLQAHYTANLVHWYLGILLLRMHAKILPSSRANDRPRDCCGSGGYPNAPAAMVRAFWPVSGLRFLQVTSANDGRCGSPSYTPAIALGSFWNLMAILQAIYIYRWLPPSTFQDLPSLQTVSQNLKIVIKLILAGFVSIGSDFFAWEFLNFASAWMGHQTLAANSVFLSSAVFFFALPTSLMNSSATRVG